MSRVDEAMRRAAEAAGAAEADAGARRSRTCRPRSSSEADGARARAVPARDAASGGPTPPRSRRRRRPATPPARPPSYDTPERADGRRRPSARSFERLDARLAEKIVVDHEHEPGVARAVPAAGRGAAPRAGGTAGCKVVMIASAVAGEGKTLTAVESGADAQRVVPAQRAAHRRRPAPAVAAHRLRHRRRARA